MKNKILSMLLLLCMMIPIIAACGDIPVVDGTTAKETIAFTPQATTSSEETTTQGKDAPPEEDVIVGYDVGDAAYLSVSNLTPFPKGVLINVRGELYYFDASDELLHRFCFDKACAHRNWQTCISLRFYPQMIVGFDWHNHRYAEYNDRFYVMRGEQFCSFASDGTDFRIEYSFGEEGNLGQYIYGVTQPTQLIVEGKYAYLQIRPSDSAYKGLYRFDMDTKKMERLTGDERYHDYFLGDGELYISVYDEAQKQNVCYLLDTETGERMPTKEMCNQLTAVVCKGRYYYFTTDDSPEADKYHLALASYDVKTGETMRLCTAEVKTLPCILAVTDDFIYFTGGETTAEVLVYDVRQDRILKAFEGLYSKNNEDYAYNTNAVYFLDGGKVLISDMDAAPDKVILADVCSDGTFANCRYVKKQADAAVDLTPTGSMISAGYRGVSNMTAFPDGVLTNVRGELRYYDPDDGKLHIFCFDEACDHKDMQSCIALKFNSQYVSMDWQNTRYSVRNGRFYVMRGQKFCSFGIDGTDLRIEYSFGDAGDLSQKRYQPENTRMKVYGQYVYMFVKEAGASVSSLYRFDMDTREMKKLNADGEYVGSYSFVDGKMYAEIYDAKTRTRIGTYCAELDLTNRRAVKLTYADGIYHNGVLYAEHTTETEAWITAYDTQTDTEKVLYRSAAEHYMRILAVTDEYLYFTGSESSSAVYVYSLRGGSVKIAFWDLYSENNGGSFRTYDIYFLDDGKVLLCDMDTLPDKIIVATVKDDGTFTDCYFAEKK